MPQPSLSFPSWLPLWMQAHDVVLWGAADLRDFPTPEDEKGERFPAALSWAVPVDPSIMLRVQEGPNEPYAAEYRRINTRINRLAEMLAAEIRGRGHRAQPLPASERTDTAGIKGDFPQKTGATRAGLGWIGKHCQLITRAHGSWVRLGMVFTDMDLPCGPPMERNFCGRCARCVEACPAGALKNRPWHPGLPREQILDVQACDAWKKEHFFEYNAGHICGICSAVCPHALKTIRNGSRNPQRTTTHITPA